MTSKIQKINWDLIENSLLSAETVEILAGRAEINLAGQGKERTNYIVPEYFNRLKSAEAETYKK